MEKAIVATLKLYKTVMRSINKNRGINIKVLLDPLNTTKRIWELRFRAPATPQEAYTLHLIYDFFGNQLYRDPALIQKIMNSRELPKIPAVPLTVLTEIYRKTSPIGYYMPITIRWTTQNTAEEMQQYVNEHLPILEGARGLPWQKINIPLNDDEETCPSWYTIVQGSTLEHLFTQGIFVINDTERTTTLYL